MSARNTSVLRAARSVVNGEGDWAEVSPALRDAIVLALTQSSVTPLRSLEGISVTCSPNTAAGAVVSSASPQRLSSSSYAAPSVLTEGNVQSSINTFEDAAWVRDEAVRSYAEFHNTIEALHAALRTQLHPVWKTAMQLRPAILADVRDELKLRRTDAIPDGIPITAAAAQHIAQQEKILDEVEDTLQMLRNTSVRFAAHFLSDEEKISMGANPAYLRAPDIDREVVAVGRSTSATRPIDDNASHPDLEDGLVNSKVSQHTHRRDSHARRRSSTADAAGTATTIPTTPANDPLLEELRAQYQQRVKELECRERCGSPVAWPRVGSVRSSCSSHTSFTQSRKGRRSHS